MLLECGFDPNRVDNYKESPLHKAAYYNHPLPVSLLVGAGAENSPNNEGKTPYDLAVSKGARPVAKYFKSAGFKKTYTVWEAISLHDFDSLGEILSNKRFVNIPDNDKVTPIFHAIKHGFDDAVKLLVNSKADLKARDLDGNTPLHYAVINQATNIIELLNKEDCKQIKNAKGQTPVALAHNTANRKIISLLR
uniref:Uncharacterized protein n=1 Tax=Arcella intermedia TaxID=1963864 RepID=A0A6B2LHL2_9EUKA